MLEHCKLPVLEVVLTHTSYEVGTLWSTLKHEVSDSTLASVGEKLKRRPAVLDAREEGPLDKCLFLLFGIIGA